MRQSWLQLLAALVGLCCLVYGEYKDYKLKHPPISIQQPVHCIAPSQYYNYIFVAYDPNTKKTWYLAKDGQYYDDPTKIR